MNKNKYILSAIGKDKPGIAAAVSQVLYKNDCNIEGSSMTLLQGEFAIILVLSSAKITKSDELSQILNNDLSDWSLMINVRQHEDLQEDYLSYNTIMCSVYGADKPGIVYTVTKCLAEHKINITDVTTKKINSEEMDGYVMLIEALMPKELDIKLINSKMQVLSKELSVDISIRQIETESL